MNHHRLVPFTQGLHAVQNVFGGGDQTHHEPVGARVGIDFLKIDAAGAGLGSKRFSPHLDVNSGTVTVHDGSGLIKRHGLDGHSGGHR